MATNFLKKLVGRSKSRSISPSNASISSTNSMKQKRYHKNNERHPVLFNLNAQDPRNFFDRTMDEINYQYYDSTKSDPKKRHATSYERKKEKISPHIVSQDNMSYVGFNCQKDDDYYHEKISNKRRGRDVFRNDHLKKDRSRMINEMIEDDDIVNYDVDDRRYINDNNYHHNSAPNSPPKNIISRQRVCDFLSPSMLYKNDINDNNYDGLSGHGGSKNELMNRYHSYNTLQSNMFGDPKNYRYQSSASPFTTPKNTSTTDYSPNYLVPENKNIKNKNISTNYGKHSDEPIYESLKRNRSMSPKNVLSIPLDLQKISGSGNDKDNKNRSLSKSPSKKSTLTKSSTKNKMERSASVQSFKMANSNIKTYNYLSPICKKVGCTATIYVTDPDSRTSKFLVCKSQLSHTSSYFRSLFLQNSSLTLPGVRQHSLNTYTLVVSSLPFPSPSLQFQWYIESTVADPVLKEISQDTLETLMRLSKRFSTPSLTIRCSQYIINSVTGKPPMIALCWLNWIIKHRFDQGCYEAVLPVVSRMSLIDLERHRGMLSERIFADILSGKLRSVYKQVSSVFKVIHEMDHFVVDGRVCPRCERTGNGGKISGGKIRLKASPCAKMIGCNHCYKDSECELEKKGNGEYEAYFKCDHDLKVFGEKTEDCWCQERTYKECFLNFESLCPLEVERKGNEKNVVIKDKMKEEKKEVK
uniref:BTB domain-containing protein n=1 Tax=Parastrongyloides trichosuri TaxID=131310 RepID=A0A0N4Z8X9_PARTI